MRQWVFAIPLVFLCLGCSDGAADSSSQGASGSSEGLRDGASPPKADRGKLSDVEWANAFFLTQIHDERWNPTGAEADTESNNCGPSSLAMLMAQRDALSMELEPHLAIDHARALMYPSYPNIDETTLPEGASLWMDQGMVFINDDDHPVYLETSEFAPSIAQGIRNGGGVPVFGSSWSEVYALLGENEALIAHGHITPAWRARFSGGYGPFDSGPVPHFIAIFLSSTPGRLIVCDPMHLGGATTMTQGELQTFFKSPVNVYETSLRVIAWTEPERSEQNTATSEMDSD